MKKKNIFIIGGLGVIGMILYKEFNPNYYNVIIGDIKESSDIPHYIKVDIKCYDELLSSIPDETDILINLVALPEQKNIVDITTAKRMMGIYLAGQYNLLYAAKTLGIKKVIFASSNHVTDFYEEDGFSTIHREITTSDYPLSESLYGVLKLAAENIGFAYTRASDLSIINLRIGTVVDDEFTAINYNDRFNRTILYKEDLINIVECAINSDIKYGTYYAVSDNKNKPWSIDNAIRELGYKPQDKKG